MQGLYSTDPTPGSRSNPREQIQPQGARPLKIVQFFPGPHPEARARSYRAGIYLPYINGRSAVDHEVGSDDNICRMRGTLRPASGLSFFIFFSFPFMYIRRSFLPRPHYGFCLGRRFYREKGDFGSFFPHGLASKCHCDYRMFFMRLVCEALM